MACGVTVTTQAVCNTTSTTSETRASDSMVQIVMPTLVRWANPGGYWVNGRAVRCAQVTSEFRATAVPSLALVAGLVAGAFASQDPRSPGEPRPPDPDVAPAGAADQ